MDVVKNLRISCKTILFPFLSSLLFASCAVQTEPTTLAERSARAAVDKAALFAGQEEIIKPISLYEAIARAIKYNSNQKVAMMEQAIAYGVADSASIDLLPQIAASGGFSTRSEQLAVSAKSVDTGLTSLEDSYIEDKSLRKAQLQIVYNVLDFGISYVNAKQASDKRYVSEEIRRKSIQQIVHNVRTAFWKAAAAQRIVDDMGVLIAAVQNELIRVNAAELSNKTKDQLHEQKKLLTALKSLMDLRNDILTAKADLATLMNLSPNTEFSLDIPVEMDQPKIIKNLGQINLEHFALVNRPELRINDYEARIAALEAKKEILRIFPGIEFEAGVKYNSNSYLKNKNWADAGIGITWNLMNLFSRPQAIQQAKNEEELQRLRRLAMTMAIMSQVNISYLQLRQNAEVFEIANSLDQVNDGLWKKAIAENSTSVQKKREALFVAVDRLISHLKRDFAYADYKGAESNLFVALGVDPLPRFLPQASVRSIAETLEDNLSRNAPRGFKDVSYDRPPSDKPVLSALGKDERAKLLQWSDFKRVKSNTAELNKRALNKPILLNPAVAVQKEKTVKVAIKKENTLPAGFKMLQVSSFEQLNKAQRYWQELTAIDPSLTSYAPIYREVSVNQKKRFRTFIADTESRLRAICKKLADELKSCLIVNH